MADVAATWNLLTSHMREVQLLAGAGSVLAWDQQTYMPRGGAKTRARQQALMTRLVHQRVSTPALGDWLGVLEGADLDPIQAAGVRNLRRSYDRTVKVPLELVQRLSIAQSEGFDAWRSAKEADDFSQFAPVLERLVELSRERAAAIDSQAAPYDVCLADFDHTWTRAGVASTFDRLRTGLMELVGAVAQRGTFDKVGASFDPAAQVALQATVAKSLGYAFDRGRLDIAEHPFTISIGPGDTRITSHVYAGDLLGGLGGVVHEAGHAMYEQGLPQDRLGTCTEGPASISLHESQSRFWECTIGRSLAFFHWLERGPLQEHFPDSGLDAARMYRAANRVAPGLIRVKADEVTYNLHIIVRFELEAALVDGSLAVSDLPDAWNTRYAEVLGIEPTSDADGVLQDVHWSSAAFGYFPSYTFGNLYAASLGATLREELPGLWEHVGAGEFEPILDWLRDRIHRHGHLHEPDDLVAQVVGPRDSVEDLLAYLWGRHGALHGLTR